MSHHADHWKHSYKFSALSFFVHNHTFASNIAWLDNRPLQFNFELICASIQKQKNMVTHQDKPIGLTLKVNIADLRYRQVLRTLTFTFVDKLKSVCVHANSPENILFGE